MGSPDKGWADSKALEAPQRHAANMRRYEKDVANFFEAQARREKRQEEAEISAEEALLP